MITPPKSEPEIHGRFDLQQTDKTWEGKGKEVSGCLLDKRTPALQDGKAGAGLLRRVDPLPGHRQPR